MKTVRDDCAPYETKDGSTIRELMHPGVHGNAAQSLAEASVSPGGITALHRHAKTEELYYVLEGRGRMTLGERTFEVAPGETVLISPLTAHRIENIGEDTLRFLCCCAPAYSHEDTQLL